MLYVRFGCIAEGYTDVETASRMSAGPDGSLDCMQRPRAFSRYLPVGIVECSGCTVGQHRFLIELGKTDALLH